MRKTLAGAVAGACLLVSAPAALAARRRRAAHARHAAGGGYISAYTLAGRATPTPTRRSPSARARAAARTSRRRDRPARHARADRQLQRLLRRLQRRRRDGAPSPVGPDLARLLPLRGTAARSFAELARARLPGRHLALRGAGPDPHGQLRRPGDRLGRATAACSWAPRAPMTRPGTPKAFGDVWVAATTTRAAPAARPSTTASATRGTVTVGKGSSAPNLSASSTTRRRSRPTAPAAAATATSTSPGRASPGTAAGRHLLRRARPTTARPVHQPDEADPTQSRTCSSRTSRSPATATSTSRLRSFERRSGPRATTVAIVQVDRLRRDVLQAAAAAVVHALRRGRRLATPRRLRRSRGRTTRSTRTSGGGRRRPRLRRLRRPLRVRLHVLPPRHAGPLHGRPADTVDPNCVYIVYDPQAGHAGADRARPTARSSRAPAASRGSIFLR